MPASTLMYNRWGLLLCRLGRGITTPSASISDCSNTSSGFIYTFAGCSSTMETTQRYRLFRRLVSDTTNPSDSTSMVAEASKSQVRAEGAFVGPTWQFETEDLKEASEVPVLRSGVVGKEMGSESFFDRGVSGFSSLFLSFFHLLPLLVRNENQADGRSVAYSRSSFL